MPQTPAMQSPARAPEAQREVHTVEVHPPVSPSPPVQEKAAARLPYEPEMILIPAGEFLMGGDLRDLQRTKMRRTASSPNIPLPRTRPLCRRPAISSQDIGSVGNYCEVVSTGCCRAARSFTIAGMCAVPVASGLTRRPERRSSVFR